MERRWYRAGTVKAAPERVDRETGAGVLRGYRVITRGLIESYDEEADDVTLKQVVDLGNQSAIGIKVGYGHPGMSSDALGTFLGRARNFRLNDAGDCVLADCHFNPTSRATPGGDRAGYVMDLAESDPQALGSSIVFRPAHELRLNPDGTRAKDANGKDLPPLVRCQKLYRSDIVDTPAANPSLFSGSSVELSARGFELLDRFLALPDAQERLFDFLERYRTLRLPHPPQGGPMDDETAEAATPQPAETAKTPETPEGLLQRLGALLFSTSKSKAAALSPQDAADVRELQAAAVEAELQALRAERAQRAIEADLAPHRAAIEPANLSKLEPLMAKLKALELAGDSEAATHYQTLRGLLPKLASPRAVGPIAASDAGAATAILASPERQSVEERLGADRMAELRKKYPALRAA